MSKLFRFKQFQIAQDRCAAKIGTDGVLLGGWVSIKSHPASILDIGTGTGIIALQLAQRSNAQLIDALELDSNAYEQATENFENSPWNDRLFCYHASFDEFVLEIEDSYDLIITNPPYYEPHQKSKDRSRDRARFEDALPFPELVQGVKKLLSSEGQFAVIVPYHRETDFIDLAASSDLIPTRITRVKGNESSPLKRSLIQFVTLDHFEKLQEDELIIEKGRHKYTEAYKTIVKDFYIKM